MSTPTSSTSKHLIASSKSTNTLKTVVNLGSSKKHLASDGKTLIGSSSKFLAPSPSSSSQSSKPSTPFGLSKKPSYTPTTPHSAILKPSPSAPSVAASTHLHSSTAIKPTTPQSTKTPSDVNQRLIRIAPRIESVKISDFTMKGHIASGTHSCIYLVSDPRGIISPNPHAEYAIKEVSKVQIKEAKLSLQIENEITIMYSQSNVQHPHPHLIQLYTHFEDSSFVYLVMEYVEGSSLRSMRLIQSLPRATKFSWMSQLANGIAQLHASQLIHRDLNPDNILINNENLLLKIGGFSWSNYFPPVNRKRTTKLSDSMNNGTAFQPFCAPEVKAKTGHAASLDIWCLGMLFYYILSNGSYPFGIPINVAELSSEEIKTIEVRMRQNVFKFDAIIQQVNPRTIALISRMLTKEPEKRPSITEVLEHEFYEEDQKEEEQQTLFINMTAGSSSLNDQSTFSAAIQRIKESDLSMRKSIAQAEKSQLNRISIADLTRITNNVNGRNSLVRTSLSVHSSQPTNGTLYDQSVASSVRKTINEETQRHKLVDQINSMIQETNSSLLTTGESALGDSTPTVQHAHSLAMSSFEQQQKFYDAPEFINELSQSIEAQMNGWIDQKNAQSRLSIFQSIAGETNGLGVISESNNEDVEKSNDQSESPFSVQDQKVLAEYVNQLLDQGFQVPESDSHGNIQIEYSTITPLTGIVEESTVEPLAGNTEESTVVPLTGIVEESTVVPLTGIIEESTVVPLTGIVEESTVVPLTGIVEESTVVPLTGIVEESTVVPLTGVVEESTVVPLTGIAESNVRSNDSVIQKVYSQYFDIIGGNSAGDESLNRQSTVRLSTLQKDFLYKNSEILESSKLISASSADSTVGTMSQEVFKANKSLLSKWKESTVDTNAELETRLAQLQEEEQRLLTDIRENEKDISNLKALYYRSKDHRFNDIDTPLGLCTSMTAKEIEICSLFEYTKYENEQKLEALTQQLVESEAKIAAQAAEAKSIEAGWIEINKIREQTNEVEEQIKQQQSEIQRISQAVLEYSDQVAKYTTFKDLEKLRDSLISQRVSLTGGNNTGIDESCLKDVIKAVSNLNKNPLLLSNQQQHGKDVKEPIPAKERISMLSDKEYQLKQDMQYGGQKIDETARLEFERQKTELLARFAEQQNAQKEFYEMRIIELQEKTFKLKLEDLPMRQLEEQRTKKKQIEGEIQALETWIEKNGRKPQMLSHSTSRR